MRRQPAARQPSNRDGWRARIGRVWFRLTQVVGRAGMAVYLSAASLIGVDALFLVVDSAAIWPVGIPVLLVVLAVVYVARRRLRAAWRRIRSGR